MRSIKRTHLALLASAAVALAAVPASAQVAVRGETVHTMAGAPIKDGVVVITNGKIAEVGPASRVKIPAGYKVLSGKVVTPGLVDAHTTVGLSGYLNQPHDQDQLDRSAPIQPELRALDAYNARERLVSWVRAFGVTTMNTGHAPGALVPGQTMIVKTRGDSVEEAVLVPTAMIAATLGQDALGQSGKAPGTRAKEVAMLREELLKARQYEAKRASAPDDKKPAPDIRLDALARVLRREVPLLLTAHRAQDIVTALRLAKEFDVRLVLDGAAESYLVVEQIKAAGVPVILHPTMQRSNGDAENLSFETASILRRAGIRVALQSGFEAYVPKTRIVLFEAAVAAANGLSFDEALATITIDAARILGVDGRVGSLETGKDGDVALYDGDPFEYTTHAIAVVVDGQVMSETVQ
jgi:imidazolonepropionase-like amidohydrolase